MDIMINLRLKVIILRKPLVYLGQALTSWSYSVVALRFTELFSIAYQRQINFARYMFLDHELQEKKTYRKNETRSKNIIPDRRC